MSSIRSLDNFSDTNIFLFVLIQSLNIPSVTPRPCTQFHNVLTLYYRIVLLLRGPRLELAPRVIIDADK